MSQQQTKTIEMALANAMQNLDAAQQEISGFRSSQESLASEKSNLESDVLVLKEEKEELELAIKNMRAELEDLNEQLSQSQNRSGELHSADDSFDGSLFDSQETAFDISPACLVIDDQKMVSTTNDNNFLSTPCSAVSVSTATTATTTSTSSSGKRRAKKAYNSPKKWRRMIRTHRLKSIFIQ